MNPSMEKSASNCPICMCESNNRANELPRSSQHQDGSHVHDAGDYRVIDSASAMLKKDTIVLVSLLLRDAQLLCAIVSIQVLSPGMLLITP